MERLSPSEVLAFARETAERYAAEGMSITLRQCYYRGVAEGMWGSGDREYKRLGDVLAAARLNGSFPLDLLEDRGRSLSSDRVSANFRVEKAIESAFSEMDRMPYYIQAGFWHGQPVYPLVLIEKEALAGFIGDLCLDLSVPFMACKGYPSHSALYDIIKQVAPAINWRLLLLQQAKKQYAVRIEDWEYANLCERLASEGTSYSGEVGYATQPTIFYAGDHDPDGIEIPKSILRNLMELQEKNPSCWELIDGAVKEALDEARENRWYNPEHVWDETSRWDEERDEEINRLNVVIPFTVKRVALTPQQINQYKPIPFPAKKSSARYEAYSRYILPFLVDGTLDYMGSGLDLPAYELDALEPSDLKAVFKQAVLSVYDDRIAQFYREKVKKGRAEFLAEFLARIPEWAGKQKGE